MQNKKTPLLEGFIFNLITFLKERGFIKYCDAKIISIFVSAKKKLKKMKYHTLEKYASVQRMNRFLIATGSKSGAMSLYRANLLVSQAFYPVLNLVEIFLRNSLYACIERYFSNSNWIITEKNGFMNDLTLAESGYYLKNSVIKAENKMLKRGIIASAEKILAEQSFSFWVSLFEPRHYKLIGGSIIHSFPNKPSHVNRKAILLLLTKIRDFRNRIYHNEPVCFNGYSVTFSHASQIRSDLLNMLEWMNLDIKKYVQCFDTIEKQINGYTF